MKNIFRKLPPTTQKFYCLMLFLLSNLLFSNNINYSKQIGNYKYTFIVSLQVNKQYTSEFAVLSSDQTRYYHSVFLNDENLKNYRVINGDKVVELSKTSKLSENQISLLLTDLDLFIESMISDLKLRSSDTLLSQLWFHYSILKTQKRKIVSGVCECTPDPMHLTGRTNFLCIEDHYINRLTSIKVIKENSLEIKDEKWKKALEFLQSSNEDNVSFKEAYNFHFPIKEYNEEIRKNGTHCILGSGSSWGCCGNYSGCCYLNSGWCLVHDAMCTSCRPRWFCLSGCIPD